MTLNVCLTTDEAIQYVVWNARTWNAMELHNAFGPHWRHLSIQMFGRIKHANSWCAVWNGYPVAVFGFTEFARGNWSVYMVSTEAVSECGRPLARKLRRTLLDFFQREQPVSVVACALAGNPKSPRWFEMLGATFDRNADGIDIYRFRVDPCALVETTRRPE